FLLSIALPTPPPPSLSLHDALPISRRRFCAARRTASRPRRSSPSPRCAGDYVGWRVARGSRGSPGTTGTWHWPARSAETTAEAELGTAYGVKRATGRGAVCVGGGTHVRFRVGTGRRCLGREERRRGRPREGSAEHPQRSIPGRRGGCSRSGGSAPRERIPRRVVRRST